MRTFIPCIFIGVACGLIGMPAFITGVLVVACAVLRND
jgi:hypothetical protein